MVLVVVPGTEEGVVVEAGSRRRQSSARDGQSRPGGRASHSDSMTRSCWRLRRQRAGAREECCLDLSWS